MSNIISVTGNAGKTTFSYFLAQKLARKNRVVIVSTNNVIPTMQYLLPISKNEPKSLGNLLSLAVIDKKSILNHMQSFKNENIGILSYTTTENKNCYPDISSENIKKLFYNLKELVDFVIVDTQTDINQIDKFAIKSSDCNFCITTADFKGLAYRQQLDDTSSITHILYNEHSYNPFEDIKQTYKRNVKYILNNYKCLRYIYNGPLLDEVSCPKKYEKLLGKILKDVILNGETDS